MKFVVNRLLDTNFTASRQKFMYKNKASGECPLCNDKSEQTVHHILSSCKWSLAQIDDAKFNQMLWRHNCILQELVRVVEPFIESKLLVDLPNSPHGYSTLPLPLVHHNEFRPDMVIIDEREPRTKVTIVELTSPLSANVDARHEEKTKKYE
jgi:hypothetical protein